MSVTPRPRFTPRERPGAHCTGGWVGPRAGLERCGKSRPHGDSIPEPSSPQPVALPTTLPGPLGEYSQEKNYLIFSALLLSKSTYALFFSNSAYVVRVVREIKFHTRTKQQEMLVSYSLMFVFRQQTVHYTRFFKYYVIALF